MRTKAPGVTIQMKAAEKYFPVALFVTPNNVALGNNEISVTIRVNATELYFPVAEIGHFQVALNTITKARLSAKLFI